MVKMASTNLCKDRQAYGIVQMASKNSYKKR